MKSIKSFSVHWEKKMEIKKKIHKYSFVIFALLVISLSVGYTTKSIEGFFLNFLFLGGYFYLGKSLPFESSKILFLVLNIIIITMVMIVEKIGIKTYLFSTTILFGIVLAFIGVMFFSEKTIKKR